jgi:hypothetical protein
MPDEERPPQKSPAEGDRETVERELERQNKKAGAETKPQGSDGTELEDSPSGAAPSVTGSGT